MTTEQRAQHRKPVPSGSGRQSVAGGEGWGGFFTGILEVFAGIFSFLRFWD